MHDDLLRQARRLAMLDAKRPKQANLRRAISSTYYAIFHFLVDQSCRQVFGTQHAQTSYRHVLGRAFAHTTMNDACKAFAGGTLKDTVKRGLPSSFSIATAVKDTAGMFVELQAKRHVADYDLTVRFNRTDTIAIVDETEDVLEQFRLLPASDEKSFFLACLWAWSNLGKR